MITIKMTDTASIDNSIDGTSNSSTDLIAAASAAGAALGAATVTALRILDQTLAIEAVKYAEFMASQNQQVNDILEGLSDASVEVAEMIPLGFSRGFVKIIEDIDPPKPKTYAGFAYVGNDTWLPRKLYENRQQARRRQARLPHRRPWPAQKPRRFDDHILPRRTR